MSSSPTQGSLHQGHHLHLHPWMHPSLQLNPCLTPFLVPFCHLLPRNTTHPCLPPLLYRDRSGSTFTAVKTSGLGGETPSSPSSPRRPPLGSSGGGTMLLKAALNSNLHKGHPAPLTPTSGSTSGSPGAAPPAAAPPAVSNNVKQRLKEYFIARNT